MDIYVENLIRILSLLTSGLIERILKVYSEQLLITLDGNFLALIPKLPEDFVNLLLSV